MNLIQNLQMETGISLSDSPKNIRLQDLSLKADLPCWNNFRCFFSLSLPGIPGHPSFCNMPNLSNEKMEGKLAKESLRYLSESYGWWKKILHSWQVVHPSIISKSCIFRWCRIFFHQQYWFLYIPGGDRQISEPSTVSCFPKYCCVQGDSQDCFPRLSMYMLLYKYVWVV